VIRKPIITGKADDASSTTPSLFEVDDPTGNKANDQRAVKALFCVKSEEPGEHRSNHQRQGKAFRGQMRSPEDVKKGLLSSKRVNAHRRIHRYCSQTGTENESLTARWRGPLFLLGDAFGSRRCLFRLIRGNLRPRGVCRSQPSSK